jgi:hypothetical protein
MNALTSRRAVVKSVLLYVVLVGTPLLGLLSIIEAGEKIVPPRSVGGDWELAGDSGSELAGSCLAAAFTRQPSKLVVSQSGPHLELMFLGRPKLAVTATLTGADLAGSFALPDGTNCSLSARVIPEPTGDRMTVTLTQASCPRCAATRFDAIRPSTSSDD